MPTGEHTHENVRQNIIQSALQTGCLAYKSSASLRNHSTAWPEIEADMSKVTDHLQYMRSSPTFSL